MSELGTLSDWQASDLVAYLASTHWWTSLHTSDPRVGVATAYEFPGASYHRVEAVMTPSGVRVLASTNGPAWDVLSAGTISHVGLFTAATGGSLRAAMPLDTPYVVLEGHGYALPVGSIYLSF